MRTEPDRAKPKRRLNFFIARKSLLGSPRQEAVFRGEICEAKEKPKTCHNK
jgi:hypothetical protein